MSARIKMPRLAWSLTLAKSNELS